MSGRVLKVLSTQSGMGEIHPTISMLPPIWTPPPLPLLLPQYMTAARTARPSQCRLTRRQPYTVTHKSSCCAASGSGMTSILCWYTHLFRDGLKTGRIYGDKEYRLPRVRIQEVLAMRSATMSRLSVKNPTLHGEAGDLDVREDQDSKLEYLDMDTNEDDLESSRSCSTRYRLASSPRKDSFMPRTRGWRRFLIFFAMLHEKTSSIFSGRLVSFSFKNCFNLM